MERKCSTCSKLCIVATKDGDYDYCYCGIDLKGDSKAKCPEYEKGVPGTLV